MSDKVTKCFAEICMTNEARAEAAEAERDLHIEEINALRKDGDDLHAERDQLQARVAELEAATAQKNEALAVALVVLSNERSHTMNGKCPDPSQLKSRDPQCMACIAMDCVGAALQRETSDG